jgi:hypothetical protein
VAAVLWVCVTSEFDEEIGCSSNALWTRNADSAARPRPAIFFFIFTCLIVQQPRCLYGLFGSDNDRLGKKVEPCLPVTSQADIVEQLILVLPVGFEVQTQKEHRGPQYLLFA